MKFSVIVALYNKAPYVESTLLSVLAQTCADLEVIVVDDGSTDASVYAVRRLSDPRVRLFRQANAGVSIARNRAIDLARGEWITFLDADDQYHPRFLEWLLFVQRQHPHIDMIGATHLTVPDDPELWPPAWNNDPAPPLLEVITDLPARWVQSETLNASSVAIRAARLRWMQPCFPPRESSGEDLDLWFRVAETTDVVLIHRAMAAYRSEVPGSLTAVAPPLDIPAFYQRMKRRARSARTPQTERRALLRLVGHHEITVARHALTLGKRMDAVHVLLTASDAARTRRWWSTLVMAVLMPGWLVGRFQAWRVRHQAGKVDARLHGHRARWSRWPMGGRRRNESAQHESVI
jgi:Glycosyl transferase family 2